MTLTLDALLVLDAIDRTGSFAAAADELFRVPSAVTYSVRKLEQDLGVAIFDRRKQRAILTPAGRELLRSGREILSAVRAAQERVRSVAGGWEVELRIAVDGMIPIARIYPLIGEFFGQKPDTEVRVLSEVFGGCWDAIVNDRADLAIGAPGEGPPGGGYVTQLLGEVSFAFVVSADHPLAGAPEPLKSSEIRRYRAVSGADSSHLLVPRTAGLLAGQRVLTVSSLEAKVEAHAAGLGVGFLPRWLAEREAVAGRLRIKRVEEPKQDVHLWVAWRSDRGGKALEWFVGRLEDPIVRATLAVKDSPGPTSGLVSPRSRARIRRRSLEKPIQ